MSLRSLACLLTVLAAAGCTSRTAPGSSVGTVPLSLGDIDPGKSQTFDVRIAATPELTRIFSSKPRIVPNSNALDVYCSGLGPDYLTFGGTVRPTEQTGSVKTSATVFQDGDPVLLLELQYQVRPAFEVQPILAGKTYAIKMLPGYDPPVAVDRSDGVVAKIVPTGKGSAELRILRSKPARVPGGMVRLMDRLSKFSRVVFLPLPSMEVSSTSVGRPLDGDGRMTIGANSGLTPDKKDVDVVLDPPGTYEIVSRGYKNGRLHLVLQSITRTPSDLTVGFRRKGKWVEVQRFQMD